MNLLKKMGIIFLMIVGTNVTAQSISLQIIQKNGSDSVVFDASYLIEQSMMDYFFEHAYIVSNSPVIIKKDKQEIKVELQKAYDSAQEGYLDYIIEATVYYNLEDSNNPEEALMENIEKIEWNVLLLSDKSVISKGSEVPQKYRNDDDSLVFFANEIAKKIESEIKTKGGLRWKKLLVRY